MRGPLFLRKAISIVLLVAATGTVLAESLTELPVRTISGRDYYVYEVAPKDTPFGLSKRFGITVDDITNYNPAVKDGLKAYSTLYFPVDAFNGTSTRHDTTPPVQGSYIEVTIEKGQSLFSIANRYGTTVDAILDANPGLMRNSYRAGETIRVPSGATVEEAAITDARTSDNHQSANSGTPLPQPVQTADYPEPAKPAVPENPLTDTENDEAVVEIAETVVATDEIENEPDTLAVTVMLPLETAAAAPSRVGQLYMEFYRGFLMGLEEKSHAGMPVKVKVIDTAVSDDEFKTILASSDIETTDLFIGPDKEQQMLALAQVANSTGAFILNPFIIKDELVHANPSIVQTNIPRTEMYAGAIEKFIELYPETVTVFLARVDGEADKVAFTEQMKERLDEAERPYKEVIFQAVLTDEDLMQLDPKKSYVFVPVSASRSEFGKFIPGLRDFKNRITMEGGEASLFGFPEWTTLRGEQLEQLRALNTVIYSRFTSADDYRVRNIKNNYNRWFGQDWADVEPNQSLLGYDTAIFAIENLRRGEGNLFPAASAPFNGVQSSYVLGRPFDGAGYVNGAMYVIKFRPYGSLDSEVVTVPVTLKLAQ